MISRCNAALRYYPRRIDSEHHPSVFWLIMGAVVHSRPRTSSSRAEPSLPRALRHLEIGAWVLTIMGALFGMYSLYAHTGTRDDSTSAIVFAVSAAVIPYVLARAIASLRRSLH